MVQTVLLYSLRAFTIGLFAVIIVLGVAGLISIFYEYSPERCKGIEPPVVDLSQSETPQGYRIRLENVSNVMRLDEFEVSILKNGEEWSGTPFILKGGSLGRGPADEYLNFTDLDGGGKLSFGDWFNLENLESGAQYELVILWGYCNNEVGSITISVP